MIHNAFASWNTGPVQDVILDFIDRVTRRGSPDYVEPEARVAVFDNDGTLWCEKPMPIQGDFLVRRIEEMAERDPSIRAKQPWKAAVEKDHQWFSDVIANHYRGDDRDLKVMAAGILQSFSGTTVDKYEALVMDFLRTARNPTLRRPYLNCAYHPMVELLRQLEGAGFTNFIASGGGRDFMRPVTQELYGIPADRVIGSSVALEYQDKGDTAEILQMPAVDIFDDGPAKPVRIWSRIGRRPIFAAGNSNGDIPMLRYCSHPSRPSLSLLIDHDDEEREFAYRVGSEDALEESRKRGWTVVSMKKDWKLIFASAAHPSERAA